MSRNRTLDCGPSIKMRWWIEETVRTTLLLLIVVSFALGWFGKAEWSGWKDYVSFFTNWSWTTHAIFYMLIALGTLFPTVRYTAILVLFLPCLNLSLFVWIMLQVIVASDPGILDVMDELPNRVFELGNEFYHSLPVILDLFFAVLFYNVIFLAYKKAWGNARAPVFLHVLNGFWQIFFPLILGGLYRVVNDPMEVYGITWFSFGSLLFIGVCLNIFIGGMLFLFYFPYTSRHLMLGRFDI